MTTAARHRNSTTADHRDDPGKAMERSLVSAKTITHCIIWLALSISPELSCKNILLVAGEGSKADR
eukprot:scaffold248326_cov66-Cyclotella_meneghiniana.AAC.1